MNTSKLLGATMVAGALATRRRACRHLQCRRRVRLHDTAALRRRSPPPRRRPRPRRPAPRASAGVEDRDDRRQERPEGKHSCPGMGSGSGSSGSSGPAELQLGIWVQLGRERSGQPRRSERPVVKTYRPSGRWRPGPHRGEALARRGGSSADDRSCQQALFPGERLAGGGGDLAPRSARRARRDR